MGHVWQLLTRNKVWVTLTFSFLTDDALFGIPSVPPLSTTSVSPDHGRIQCIHYFLGQRQEDANVRVQPILYQVHRNIFPSQRLQLHHQIHRRFQPFGLPPAPHRHHPRYPTVHHLGCLHHIMAHRALSQHQRA